jgi:2-phospho-L-lactate transferase/gluconeogenesis factor (CofD/UPF0052 family)
MNTEQSTPLYITNIAGGGAGGVMARGLGEAFPGAEVVIVTPATDSGGSTESIRAVTEGPAPGDVSAVLSAASRNDAGPLFKERFDDGATIDDLRRKNDAFLGLLGDKATDHAAAALDFAVEIATQLPKGENGAPELGGHKFGNLAIAGLWMAYKGDLVAAAERGRQWLDVKARVVPVTSDSGNLVMYDGAKNKIIHGEGLIDVYPLEHPDQARVWLEKGTMKNFFEDNPRRVKAMLEAADHVPKPQVSPEAKAASSYSDITIGGPGSPITTQRAVTMVEGVAEGMEIQQRRGGLLVAVANLDQEKSTPNLTLDRYLSWLETDMRRPFTHVIHDDPSGKLPERIALHPDEDSVRIRDAVAIGTALVAAGVVKKDPKDKIAHVRADRHHNPFKVADVLTLLARELNPDLVTV